MLIPEVVREALVSSKFDLLERVASEQVSFCSLLGLNVKGFPERVAFALAYAELNSAFGAVDARPVTEKQLNFSKSRGVDLSGTSRPIADAVVDALFMVLNLEAIAREKLEPGLAVVNVHDRLKSVEVISTVDSEGIVYFKGGNGKRAWARSFKRAGSVK